AKHIGTPTARALRIARISSREAAAFNARLRIHCLPRNTAHHVKTELQSHRVNFVGERLETLSIRGGRKAIWRGEQTPIGIRKKLRSHALLVEVSVVERRYGVIPAGTNYESV